MPKTKYISQISILLLGLFVLLGFVFGFNIKTNEQKAMAQDPSSLIDLNDDDYLIDQAMLAGGNFSTLNGGAYDYNTNPYVIATAVDLVKLAFLVDYFKDTTYASASYILTNHINLSGYNWRPIGQLGTGNIPFSGMFNGNGYSIYGLTINLYYRYDGTNLTTSSEPDVDDVVLEGTSAGLFGAVSNQGIQTTIKLLGLTNTTIHTNAYYTGSVVGIISGDPTDTNIVMQNAVVSDATASAVIQECYNKGLVDGGTYVGGIAGYVCDGAVVFNCENGEASLDFYNDVTYGTNNETGPVAVYSAFDNSNVGGIAGGVEETTTKAVIASTINTAGVGKYGNGDNIGGIVGYYPSGSKNKYSSNIFLQTAVYTSNISNMAGTPRTLSNMTRDFVYTNSGNFSITTTTSDQYIPYSRGATPDAIWHKSDAVNNGIPYLTRVSPLLRVELQVKQTDQITPATINFMGYDTDGVSVSTMDWYKPLIISGNVFYIEQGKSVPVETHIKSQYSTTFEFLDWEMEAVECNVTDPTKASGIMAADILFVATDGVYTAVYDYVYYDISLSANNGLYGSIVYQDSENDDPTMVDWGNIAIENNSTIHSRINSVVRVIAVPNAGYRFDEVLCSNYASFTEIDENTIEFTITTSDMFTFVFVQKLYAVTVSVPTDSNSIPLADVVFTVNNGSEQTSVLDALYNDVVRISISNIKTNYFLDYYQICPQNETPINLAQGVNTFIIQDYDSYQIVPVFRKQTYSVTLNKNSSNFDVSFVTPSSANVLLDIEFDQEFSACVSNILVGYHFVEWNIAYEGDINEAWNGSQTIITKQGLSGNVVLTPVVVINEYTVVLSKVGDGSILNEGSQTVCYGTTFSSTATPTNGNKFVAWYDENDTLITKRANLVLTIEDNLNIYAKFEVVKYNLVFDILSDDGANFMQDIISQTNANGKYYYGDSVEFSLICPNGYTFLGYQMQTDVDQSKYQFNTDGTGVLNSIEQDITISVNLALKTFKVSFEINDQRFGDFKFNYDGWTLFSSNFAGTEFDYPYKSEVIAVVLSQSQALYPEIAKNYAFSYWIVNGVPYDVGTTLTLSVDKNLNIKAYYRPLSYRLYVTKSVEDGATINGVSSDYFEYGSQVTLNVNLNSGYVFNGWLQYNPVERKYNQISTEKSVTITIDGSKNILCSLSKLGTIVANVNNSLYGSVSGTGEYKVGMRITLVAVAQEDYIFSCWKQDGEIVSYESSLTLDVVEGTQSYEAMFLPKFAVNITPNNKKLGSVEITSSDLKDSVVLVAKANNNCSFVGWAYNNEIISTSSTFNLNLNGDIALEAVFAKDFNWNTLIIVAGCLLFAIVLLIIAIQYVRAREAEPIKTNYIMKTGANKEKFPRKQKVSQKDIQSIPVRKINTSEIEPIPVRKTRTITKGYKPKNIKNKDKK